MEISSLLAKPTVKVRGSQPYRIDWDRGPSTVTDVNKQLGKLCNDIDYTFQIIFELLKSIATQINTISSTSGGGSSSTTNDIIQGLTSLGIDGADGEDAFPALGTSTTSGGTVNLAGSGVSGILPLVHGGSGSDLSGTGGAHQVVQQASGGANLTVGTIASTDLSDTANVALLGSNDAFTGNNTFAGTSTFNGIISSTKEWDISADIHLRNVISPSALSSGNNNDWNPTGIGSCNVIRVTTDAGNSTLTGIVAPSTDGKLIILTNIGPSGVLSLSVRNAASTAANRLEATNTFSVAVHGSVWLWYDGTSSLWRIIWVN